MNPKTDHSESIKNVLAEIADDTNSVKWTDFTLRMADTIIADKIPGSHTNQLKRIWKTHFTKHSKQLNFNIIKGGDNWHIIEKKISNIQNTVDSQDLTNNTQSPVQSTLESSSNTTNSRTQKSSSSTSSSSNRSSSSSAKSSSIGSQLSETITIKEKEEILNIYRKLDEEKLWTLSTGKIVEKEMIKLVEKSIYEHPAHSFILDPDDENWTEHFSVGELEEIRTHKSRELPTLPGELVEFLGTIEQMGISEMHKLISDIYFDPLKDFIRHWAKKCLLEGVELFMTDFFKNENVTERDLLSRVWRLILLAFDQGKMRIREEIYSKSTNTQINKKRKLSNIDAIERKATSIRADQLITYGNHELGIVEGSKVDNDHSSKYFLDSMKKAPKSMKDMLLQLIKISPNNKHGLRTIAIITSKLEMDMLMMDLPEHYVFRVQRTETIRYPCVFDMFVKEIRSCLEMTWLARMILEKTVENLTSSTCHVPIGLKSAKQDDLPTFYKKKSK